MKKKKKNLKIHEIENVKSVNEKLNNGYKNSMPYDLIFINGCLSESPKIFLDQLDSVGRLVCIESIDFNIKKIVHFGGCPYIRGWASHFNTLLLRTFAIIILDPVASQTANRQEMRVDEE